MLESRKITTDQETFKDRFDDDLVLKGAVKVLLEQAPISRATNKTIEDMKRIWKDKASLHDTEYGLLIVVTGKQMRNLHNTHDPFGLYTTIYLETEVEE